uniref:Lipoprotein n=1 Tax=Angiostrongylus cantonensis TaxID=6313 RepID=A0A0K0D4I9_ANGCA
MLQVFMVSWIDLRACFSTDRKYKGSLVNVGAHVTNGFSIKDNVALMVLSDVVVDRKNQAVCDDWLKWIKVDGTLRNNHREQRVAGYVAF